VTFLQNFNGIIDLLYLDAWDAVEGIPYAQKHLEAYQMATEKLSPSSIVLIDDTDIAIWRKGPPGCPVHHPRAI